MKNLQAKAIEAKILGIFLCDNYSDSTKQACMRMLSDCIVFNDFHLPIKVTTYVDSDIYNEIQNSYDMGFITIFEYYFQVINRQREKMMVPIFILN